jgi:hypothetical protein
MGLTSCRRITIAKTLAQRRRECAIGMIPTAVSLSNATPSYVMSPFTGLSGCQPFSQQRRLADAGVRGDEGQLAVDSLVHTLTRPRSARALKVEPVPWSTGPSFLIRFHNGLPSRPRIGTGSAYPSHRYSLAFGRG